MIDFDALVISPLQTVFGRPIWVTPKASQPGQPGYWSRGDYRIANIDVQVEGQDILSETTLTMGVRVADFPVPVGPRDEVYVPAFLRQPAAGPFAVHDTDDDSQGHSLWVLKEIRPTTANVNDDIPAA